MTQEVEYDPAAPPVEMPPIAPLRPITDPLELRDRTIRDYTRNMGAAGMPADAAGIERLAKADLQLADAYKRDEPVGMAPSEASRIAAREAARAAAEAKAREDGIEIKREARDLGPQFDLPPEYGNSERWRLAKGRMARIVAGAGAPLRHPDGSFDFRAMTSTCEIPHLAYRYLCAWFNFDFRYIPETARHNPFFMMPKREASMKLAREVEDICDTSSGRLGPWFVPK